MRVDENGNSLIKSEAQFTFELEGDSYVDAVVLSNILNNTVDIVNQIVNGDPDTYVKLRISKFETGSFDIVFQAIAEQVNTLMGTPLTAASTLVNAMGGAFKIAKFLKGKKAKEVVHNDNSTTIINIEGNVLHVEGDVGKKYFENAKIENSVINIVNTVESDTVRPGFKIHTNETDKEKAEVIEFSRDDFSFVEPVVEKMLEEEEQYLENIMDVELIIRKPDLIGNSRWGFILDKYIEASIEDEDWLNNVRANNIKFGRGMRLPVKLKVVVKLDKNGAPLPDPTYSIIKVTGDVIDESNQEQTKLDVIY